MEKVNLKNFLILFVFCFFQVTPAFAVNFVIDGLSSDTQVTDLGEKVRMSGGWGEFIRTKADFLKAYGIRNSRGNLISFRVSGELTPEGKVVYQNEIDSSGDADQCQTFLTADRFI